MSFTFEISNKLIGFSATQLKDVSNQNYETLKNTFIQMIDDFEKSSNFDKKIDKLLQIYDGFKDKVFNIKSSDRDLSSFFDDLINVYNKINHDKTMFNDKNTLYKLLTVSNIVINLYGKNNKLPKHLVNRLHVSLKSFLGDDNSNISGCIAEVYSSIITYSPFLIHDVKDVFPYYIRLLSVDNITSEINIIPYLKLVKVFSKILVFDGLDDLESVLVNLAMIALKDNRDEVLYYIISVVYYSVKANFLNTESIFHERQIFVVFNQLLYEEKDYRIKKKVLKTIYISLVRFSNALVSDIDYALIEKLYNVPELSKIIAIFYLCLIKSKYYSVMAINMLDLYETTLKKFSNSNSNIKDFEKYFDLACVIISKLNYSSIISVNIQDLLRIIVEVIFKSNIPNLTSQSAEFLVELLTVERKESSEKNIVNILNQLNTIETIYDLLNDCDHGTKKIHLNKLLEILEST